MDKKAGQKEAVVTPAASPLAAPATPVRSAKDAINAMYAQSADKRLSNYLASSAQEIINASGRGSAKSAANLHRGSIQHQMEARPSASGILRTAKAAPKPQPKNDTASMDPLARKTVAVPPKRPARPLSQDIAPVVKTSLKLSPKRRAAATTAPRRAATVRPQPVMLSASKGQTTLSKLLDQRKKTVAGVTSNRTQPVQLSPAADAAESVRIMQQAARRATGQPEPVSVQNLGAQPKRRTRRGMMQDIIQPRRPATVNPVATPEYPADSIRHRFRPAPKDYAAQATTQADSYLGYDEDFADGPTQASKPPVDIYGMMDEEPTGNLGNLGVVEDYNPSGGLNEQKVAAGSGKSAASDGNVPDNNKYALGGQSPFFLKSVNVEKRPLSDGPKKSPDAPAGTLYEHPSTEPVNKKNVYEKSAPSKKAIPSKPTVIIPASRRSKAPLICLLILTVLLGAAVGAFIYLCFFQYME